MTPQTSTTSRLPQRWRTMLLSVAVLYSAFHFWYSGIYQPNSKPFTPDEKIPQTRSELIATGKRMVQTLDQLIPLINHVREGGPTLQLDRRQYGPVFFFLMHPALLASGDNFPLLCHWIYGMELLSLVVAFVFCILSLRLWLNDTDRGLSLSTGSLIALLGLLWLNFSPMYYILSAGVPEMWELALISMALYWYLRGWRFLASLALVAAAMIKMLPAVLLFYFVCRDRRTLWYAILSAGLLLSLSQLLYGWGMGFGYPWRMAANIFGDTHGITAHENVSLKGMIVKLFAGFRLGGPDGYQMVIDDHGLIVANLVAQLAQVAGIAWTGWILTRPRPAKRHGSILWEWSWLSGIAMLLAPSIAFEYMTLSLLAFSVALVAFAVDPHLRQHRLALGCFGVAVLLVANIVPRQVLNRLLPIAAITRLAGTTHITLSEAYQWYGFPFVGMVCFLVALWMIRRRVVAA